VVPPAGSSSPPAAVTTPAPPEQTELGALEADSHPETTPNGFIVAVSSSVEIKLQMKKEKGSSRNSRMRWKYQFDNNSTDITFD